jgi:hypothetical protein
LGLPVELGAAEGVADPAELAGVVASGAGALGCGAAAGLAVEGVV